MSKDKHTRHKRVAEHMLHQGYSNLWQHGRHRAGHLAERAVEFARLRGSKCSRLQLLALDHYHHEEEFNIMDNTLSDKLFFRSYLRLFDEMFFFRSIADRIDIYFAIDGGHNLDWNGKTIVADEPEPKKSFKDRMLGDSKPQEKKLKFEMIIYPKSIQDDQLRRLHYLSTILHEMIHVFLYTYTCEADSCRLKFDLFGISGHGLAWQEIALAIEEAANDPAVLGLALDLDRSASLALEIIQERDKLHHTKLMPIDRNVLIPLKIGPQQLQDELARVNKQQQRESARHPRFMGKKLIANVVSADL